jgi:hypothetical protein
MNKVCQVVLGAVAFAAVSVGVVGEAKAVNPNHWTGLFYPATSPETAINTATNHAVTIQATLFNTSLWATLTSANYYGTWINSAALSCNNGFQGQDALDSNIVLFCPFGGLTIEGASYQAGLTAF